jgi:hypothetical protein
MAQYIKKKRKYDLLLRKYHTRNIMYEEFLGPDFRGVGYILQDEEVVLERVSGYRDRDVDFTSGNISLISQDN